MASQQDYSREKFPAELEAFDFYLSKMTSYLDSSTMQGKLVSYSVVDGKVLSQTGPFLPNQMNMEILLKEVRSNIGLNGPQCMNQLIQALNSERTYQNLANQLSGKSPTSVGLVS